MEKVGSRAKVMHGTAEKTSGGLKKNDLKYNKYGKIVSKKASLSAKKVNNLGKAGYSTKKGIFGYILKGGSTNNVINNKVVNNKVVKTESPENKEKWIRISETRKQLVSEITGNKNMTGDLMKLYNELNMMEMENKQSNKDYKSKLEEFLTRTGMTHVQWNKCLKMQQKFMKKKSKKIKEN
jgi:predicted RNase H-like nuclease (RuvC/YqgF family)